VSVLAYLRETSEGMRDRYAGDCLKHARHIASLLRVEGNEPWIGRIRDEVPMHGSFYRHPLIPRRWEGITWETHYVACAGREVYDPIVGEPVDVDEYAERVFGRKLPVERSTFS
jgi:hypothetical protein